MQMEANILLAEDDRALSALILDFFHAAGLEVLPVYDGAAALAAVQDRAFDLLILDVMMPHFSGLEVCRRVRETSGVPILFLTALSQEENALAGYRGEAARTATRCRGAPFSSSDRSSIVPSSGFTLRKSATAYPPSERPFGESRNGIRWT